MSSPAAVPVAGIGAAWFEGEHDDSDVRFPPLREQLIRLEEALRIVLRMWGAEAVRPIEMMGRDVIPQVRKL